LENTIKDKKLANGFLGQFSTRVDYSDNQIASVKTGKDAVVNID
jgi:hypothetical protein